MSDLYRARIAAMLSAVSVALEGETGVDSIPTIKSHYVAHDNPGVYACPFPGCPFRRRDPILMWRHVHFSPSHPGAALPDDESPTIQALGERARDALRRYTSPLRAVS